MYINQCSALPTLDVAAPLEFAFASFDDLLREGVVASSTAHQRATIGSHGCLVTLATRRAQ